MKRTTGLVLSAAVLLWAAAGWTDDYSDAAGLFRNSGQSSGFFATCYGYAIFPGIGKGGFIVGGAHGNGRVLVHGKYVGDTSMTQLSVGFQAGGQAYSQIIFFEDKRAFDEFTKGNFEFGADAQAVAITAAASSSVGTTGANAGASGGMHDATTAGRYYKGFAVFTVVKGGAMFQAAIAGQKFSYTPRA